MWIKLLTSGWTYTVVMAALFGWQLLKNAQMETVHAQEARDAAVAWGNAITAARTEEQAKTQQYIASLDQLTKDNEALANEKDRVLADLHNANLRLRRRFQCPTTSVPGDSGTATSGDGASQSGLLVADAEFLVRLAAEADARVNQLTACQNVLKERE